MRLSAASRTPDFATAALTQERARDDHHDVVRKALEGLVGRDDADEHRGQEGDERDEIVAQAPPHEEAHHPCDDGEGKDLGNGHRRLREER